MKNFKKAAEKKAAHKKKTILFTGAGGSGTIAIIKALKNKYRIIAVDMNPYAAGLYLAHRPYLMPPCTDSKYLKEMQRIVAKEKVDVVVPLIDEELLSIKHFYRNQRRPAVLVPRETFIRLCLNKLDLMNALEKAEIPCPKTYLLPDLKTSPASLFPCIVKPITSRGSRGFQYLNNRADLGDYLNSSPWKKKELIIQEAVQGEEFTVSVVVDQEGEVLSVVPKQVIQKKGITKIAVTRNNQKIIDVCHKIQRCFQANGPFNVQLILEKNTKLPKIFEINPRFSTTVVLTMESGVKEVEVLIERILGRKVVCPKFKNDLVMIRYEEQYYLPEKQVKKFFKP